MGWAARCGRLIPVVVVVSIIAWCYTIFTLDFLLPMLAEEDKESLPVVTLGLLSSADGVQMLRTLGLGYLIGFNGVFALGTLSFLLTVFADPGRVPETWVVTYDAEGADLMGADPARYPAVEKKLDGVSRRICRKSQPNVYKPDRAHFCRVLGRCVLKMDHFCPWLNNCIGFYNHKFFVLLISYMSTLAVFMVVVLWPSFAAIVSHAEHSGVSLQAEFRVCLTYLMTCLLALALLAFLGFHTYLLARNYTTIEFLEKRGCNPPPEHVNSYDLGTCRNIAAVMGDNPLLWWLPVRWTVRGDGLAFPTNSAALALNNKVKY